MIDWGEAGPLANQEVEGDEDLSHFLERKSEISQGGSTKGQVKPFALIPFSGTGLSVTREKDLSAEQVWESGLATIQLKNSNQLKKHKKEYLRKHESASDSEAEEYAKKELKPLELRGKATFKADQISKFMIKATVVEPPRNHVDLVGWPSEKSRQMEIARDLFEFVETFVYPLATKD